METPVHPPRLPREFYARSAPAGLAFVAFTLAAWLVPGVVASELVARAPVSLWLLAPALTALVLVAAHGLHLAGWVGHEGFHFNLFRSRSANALVGILVSSATVFFVQVGVAIDHHNHHRYTNAEGDPDLALFGRQEGFWSRLFFTRLRANRAFLRDALRLLLGRPLDMDMRGLPLARSTLRWLALFNLACCAAWLVVYVLLFRDAPLFVVWTVMLPLAAANLLTGLRPYLEHAATDSALMSAARSRTHPWLVFVFFGNSLHLEHHFYPSVPCYRLPRVRRWLRERGFYGTNEGPSSVERGLFGAYRWTVRPHAYGTQGTASNAPMSSPLPETFG